MSPQLVVREHSPWKQYVIIFVLLLLVIVGGYVLYKYGLSRAGHDFESLTLERELLQTEISRLESELAEQRDQAVVLQRSGEIDQQAYKEVDESLRSLQSEILELKEEVAFYRSIVAPRESAKGLRIQRFKIEANRQPRSFRYKLVLTQVIKHSRVTRGSVELNIEGLQNGQAQVLSLKQVENGKKDKLSFRFKYFQNFEGDMILPEGFVPSRVLLKVVSNRVTIEKSFDWPRTDRKSDSLKTSGL
jgi:hypothetical protein